jgi:hypothetical protein
MVCNYRPTFIYRQLLRTLCAETMSLHKDMKALLLHQLIRRIEDDHEDDKTITDYHTRIIRCFATIDRHLSITNCCELTLHCVLSQYTEIKIRKYVGLPFVLRGCKTGLMLRTECRLSVFENRVGSGIFRLERVEVMGSWRELHSY